MKIMANLRNCSKNYVKQGVYTILGTVQASDHMCHPNWEQRPLLRTFSRTSQLAKSKNYYDDLEIPKSSTQSEIKSAYYNLSKAYHPDKNKTEVAAKKFREISDAYEVLGNFRKRRMYDKGIGSYGRPMATESPGTESEIVNEPVEDDAQTKFYKQHMVKSQVPEMTERMTARDFDAWSSQRITQAFQHKQNLKNIYREREEDQVQAEHRSNQLTFCILVVLVLICVHYILHYNHSRSVDSKIRNGKTS